MRRGHPSAPHLTINPAEHFLCPSEMTVRAHPPTITDETMRRQTTRSPLRANTHAICNLRNVHPARRRTFGCAYRSLPNTRRAADPAKPLSALLGVASAVPVPRLVP